MKIVDEFTGRILEGRRWSEGLHQAVEAKEGVKIKEENQTLATVTLQNYFRMYDKLARHDRYRVHRGRRVRAHLRPRGRVDPDQPADGPRRRARPHLQDRGREVRRRSPTTSPSATTTGQPVLVGTISVEKSEQLSRLLEKRGIPHEVLNAKQHEREAEIVTQAGRLGAVTVATNMAGRGVDILLGGNPEGLAREELLAERHHASRSRPRSTRSWSSSSRCECADEGDKVRELGGLYVLGTERHESRRIDNQLRGRAGRQGDPGESRFYLSLEDELMRLFATGAMNWVMGKAFPDDMPLEAKMVTKAIERAQRTVEDRNFEIRKDVLKYDEVMNEQRKVIYRRRQQILDGGDLRDEALDAIESRDRAALVDQYCVGEFSEDWDVDELARRRRSTYFPTRITKEQLDDVLGTARRSIELLVDDAVELYEDEGSSRSAPRRCARSSAA